MINMKLMAFGLIFLILFSGCAQINPPIENEGVYEKGKVFVKFNDASMVEVNNLIESNGLTWEAGSPITIYGPLRGRVIVEEGKEQYWIDILEQSELVEYAEVSPVNRLADQ